MFNWFGKGKGKDPDKQSSAPVPAVRPEGKPSKDELIRQAMANARVARDVIGEETLSKLSAMIEKKNRQMQLEKMKQDLIRKMETDSGKVADHLKFMLHDKNTDH